MSDIDKLRAALKPFAEAAEGLDPSDEDGWLMWEHPQASCVRVGDFRAAAKAFKENHKISFEDWLLQLKSICKAYDVEDYVEQTGEECWREMYDDGLSPEDAWGEEVHAASTMG